MNLAEVFDALIDPDWKLSSESGFWQVKEPGSPHSLFAVGGCKSYGFSLDHKTRARFPFFRENSQPGMQKANDAIVVAESGDHSFVALIELKAARSEARKALTQIEAGRLFVNWVKQLLGLHGHWRGEPRFFGVVSLKPRRQERKGITRRSAEVPAPKQSKFGYPVFYLENHPRVSIPDLISKLGRAV